MVVQKRKESGHSIMQADAGHPAGMVPRADSSSGRQFQNAEPPSLEKAETVVRSRLGAHIKAIRRIPGSKGIEAYHCISLPSSDQWQDRTLSPELQREDQPPRLGVS
jgi:hypothetical protein